MVPQIPAEAFSFCIAAMLVWGAVGVTGFLIPAPKLAVFQMFPKASPPAFLGPPAAEFGVVVPVLVLPRPLLNVGDMGVELVDGTDVK